MLTQTVPCAPPPHPLSHSSPSLSTPTLLPHLLTCGLVSDRWQRITSSRCIVNSFMSVTGDIRKATRERFSWNERTFPYTRAYVFSRTGDGRGAASPSSCNESRDHDVSFTQGASRVTLRAAYLSSLSAVIVYLEAHCVKRVPVKIFTNLFSFPGRPKMGV